MKKTLTTSMIRAFKACRRSYELQYIEQLKPKTTPEALATGISYHKHVENILKGTYEKEETITGVMAEVFKEIILPRLPKIKEVEKQFEVELCPNHFLVGKIDAITEDGIPVEHKTTSAVIDEAYKDKLRWDDQVTDYLVAESVAQGKIITKVIYTVIRKPSIRLKTNETEQDYRQRCIDWYKEDTGQKVNTFPVTREAEEIIKKQDEIVQMFQEIYHCKLFYKNPCHCSILGCQYSSICLDYVPEIGAVDFEKKTQRNEELDKVYF